MIFSGFSIEGPSQARIDCHDNGELVENVDLKKVIQNVTEYLW